MARDDNFTDDISALIQKVVQHTYKKSAVNFDLTPKIWTIHIRTDDDIVSDSVLLILVESVDDYSNPIIPYRINYLLSRIKFPTIKAFCFNRPKKLFHCSIIQTVSFP